MRTYLAAGLILVLTLAPTAVGAVPPPSLTDSISPAPQVEGRYFNAHPLSHYALDYHVDGPDIGVGLGGVSFDASSVPALIAQFMAAQIWEVTKFLVNAVIDLFTWAFSLDLLNGSAATGGEGTLDPISKAITSLHENVLGHVWMSAAIILAGLWGIWKALVQRRYAEGLGGLALSVLFVVLALFLVNEPQATIGQASRWTSQLSLALLSGTSTGSLEGGTHARTEAADQLFKTLIHDPWVVLDFGAGKGTEQLAQRYLAHPPGSPERDAEYQRLAGATPQPTPPPLLPPADGKKQPKPEPDPLVSTPDPHESAVVAIQGQAGAFERLTVAAVVFAGDLGAIVLIGFLSLAVLLTQVLALMLLAFAPVALIIAVFPGRGHDFFRGWLSKLATAVVIKAIYSLTIAVVLAVAAALTSATGGLGFLLSFGLECTFFWAVFLNRKQLAARLGSTGGGSANPVVRDAARTASSPLRAMGAGAAVGAAAVSRRVVPSARPPDNSSFRNGPKGERNPATSRARPVPRRGEPADAKGERTRARLPHGASKPTPERKPPHPPVTAEPSTPRGAATSKGDRPPSRAPSPLPPRTAEPPAKKKPKRASAPSNPVPSRAPSAGRPPDRPLPQSARRPKGPVKPPGQH